MADTDREMLELAAKAAGITGAYSEFMDAIQLLPAKDTPYGKAYSFWNPLQDDGEALRLAVKLCITDLELAVGQLIVNEGFQEDKYAATRRAIVRAAAELARAQGEKQ